MLAAIPIARPRFALERHRVPADRQGPVLRGVRARPAPEGHATPTPTSQTRVRDAELRQLLEAKAYRQRARGEEPLDVEAELERIRAEEVAGPGIDDPALVEEVRQLVVARNARRERRGEEPLDVEAEVARQLRDLEGLGQ